MTSLTDDTTLFFSRFRSHLLPFFYTPFLFSFFGTMICILCTCRMNREEVESFMEI